MIEDRAAWLRLRRETGIAATEIAAVYGVDDRTSALELYYRKRGEVPEPDLSRVERVVLGQKLEAGIASAAASLHGLTLRRGGFHAHPGGLPLCCTLDFEYEHPEHGWVPFEVKNVDGLVWRDAWKHRDDGTHEPPLPIDLQVQVQMLVTGSPVALVCVLVGGSRLELVPRAMHPPTQQGILRKATEFWRRIQEGDPPPVDLSRDLSVLKLTRTDASGEPLDARGRADATRIMEMYCAGVRKTNEGEDLKQRAKAAMLLLAGTAPSVRTDHGKVVLRLVPGHPAHRRTQVCKETTDHRDVRFYPDDKEAKQETGR